MVHWPLLAPGGTAVADSARPPSFSVIVAAYQAANTIGDALQSALAQTVLPQEVIVCDDGSTDELDDALRPFGDRITVLRRPENGGEAAAKNAASLAASGEFVVILDADDIFLPRRLEALGELAAERPDLDILTTDAFLELDGRRLRRCYEPDWPFETGDQRRGILERNFIFGLAAVRREALLAAGGFDESIRWTTDWDCWIRMIIGGARAGAVAEPLAVYRLHERSLSTARVDHIAGRLQTLRKASAIPALTPAERRVVEGTISEQEQELALLEARAAVLERRQGTRRRLIRLAARRGTKAGTRAKALAAALSPALAGRVMRHRDGGAWTAAGGIRVTPPADRS
jgi:Glycosyl transferase family 2